MIAYWDLNDFCLALKVLWCDTIIIMKKKKKKKKKIYNQTLCMKVSNKVSVPKKHNDNL